MLTLYFLKKKKHNENCDIRLSFFFVCLDFKAKPKPVSNGV